MKRLYGLPENTEYSADMLAGACLSDKKQDGGKLTMVFPLKIGKCMLKDIPTTTRKALTSHFIYNIMAMLFR